MIGVLLGHPTRQAIGSGFKTGTVGVTPHRPVCQVALILISPGLGLGWECGGLLLSWVAVTSGVGCITSVPLAGVKPMLG